MTLHIFNVYGIFSMLRSVFMLNVIKLSASMLSIIIPSVFMLSVVASFWQHQIWDHIHNFIFNVIIVKPGACTTKHYGFVIYRKWNDFAVS